MHISHIWKYYVAAFLGGFVTLALEIVGLRAIAPYFGYSTHASASLIGLVLFALSIGYWIGGWWGDKKLPERRFALVLLAGALYVFFVVHFYSTFLSNTAHLSVTWGALVASLVLLAPAMVLFATLAPYFVSHTARHLNSAGLSAGTLYAAGTIGSLVGTFAASLYLIPQLGVWAALLVLAGIAVLPGALLLGWRRGLLALVLFALLALVLTFTRSTTAESIVVESVESPYSHLEVVELGDKRALRAERQTGGVYSLVTKDGSWDWSAMLYNLFGVPPLLGQKENTLLLGVGGTIPLIYEQVAPESNIAAVDIDPEIFRLARKYLFLDERTNISETHVTDARRFLAQDDQQYNIINIDIFRGGDEIPFYLATKEFFTLTKKRLSEDGLVAMNVYDPSDNQQLAEPIANTLAAVYPSVYQVSAGNGSYFLLASKNTRSRADILNALEKSNPPSELNDTISLFKNQLTHIAHSPEQPTFTDNWAPVEQLVAR